MSRRWTNILLIFAGGIVGLIVLLAVFVNTSPGRRTVVSLVGSLSDNRVTITGLSGSIPYSLRAERVEVRDDEGLWLIAEHVALALTSAGPKPNASPCCGFRPMTTTMAAGIRR